MRLLALDSTTGSCSVSAFAASGPVIGRTERMATGQAERIVPMIGEVMREAGWTWDSVDALVVCIGPGTFTGIRAGVAAGRALALAADRPCVGVTSLESLAAAAPSLPAVCLIAGRQGSVFAQRFAGDGDPDGAARNVDLAAALALAHPGDHIVVEASGAAAAGSAEPVQVDATAAARAALRRLARGQKPGPGFALAPFYLRDSGAEANAGRPLVGPAA